MRILVVEDERRIANSVKTGLNQENYAVDVAYDGIAGYDLAATEDYDLIILDLMLPGKSGSDICQALREEKNQTPIIILTAKSQISDKISGLDSGADDYLTKPFAFEELLARIRALARRPKNSLSSLLSAGNLTLDPKNLTVSRSGQTINLSAKEFSVLEYLLRNQGKVVTKEQMIAHVWNYDANVLPNTVEVNIKNIRRKLGRPELIRTRRGFGYQIG